MSLADRALIATFWACAGLVVYAYAGYALAIHLFARWFGREPIPPAVDEGRLPTVALLIAAHDEETVIDERVRNALAIDYPRDRFEVVVASDGSSDATAEIVRGYADRGVRLIDYRERRGKSAVLNETIAGLTAEVVVLSDANTFNDPDAVRMLARWFADPSVGSVVGRLILTDPATGRNADGLYWKYETFLKTCEARLGALLGANGAIYAIRRALYVPIPDRTIVDDFVIPLLSELRHGRTIVYDVNAVAREETPADLGQEFHRRARIGAGGFQAIGILRGLLDPRRGWVAFAFLSHKVLRWTCPAFLIGLAASNVALAFGGGPPFYKWALAAQAAFYLTAGLVALAPPRFKLLKPLRLATMFASMNAALLVGFFRWAFGSQGGIWRRTERPSGASEPAR
jgi:cellulose synthase/poly-beta-1,6-N-acetylglucosamine synthase-like glycosyltransferase